MYSLQATLGKNMLKSIGKNSFLYFNVAYYYIVYNSVYYVCLNASQE